MAEDSKEFLLLPHHGQRPLCTSRLPYRQGRKMTAVKVYSINNESKHLLVFGVPSLNLRQETKALFSKFGKLQLNITKYPSEQFTETYHAVYESIQSARIAKKMLDTKNFYGGSLHICYAPELETIEETEEKLLLRQKNVVARLKNLQKPTAILETDSPSKNLEVNIKQKKSVDGKLYMGNENDIQIGKRKDTEIKSTKRFKRRKTPRDTTIADNDQINADSTNKLYIESEATNSLNSVSNKFYIESKPTNSLNSLCDPASSNIEVVDITSADIDVVTNINESLNYNNFGKEIIREVPYKPVNKIRFNLNKKT